MRQYFLSLLVIYITSYNLFSQGIKDVIVDHSTYPTILIDFNLRNPKTLDESKILLSENGKPIEFELEKKSDSTLYSKSTIFILFENSYWNRFEQQRAFGKELFNLVFYDLFDDDITVDLATFDWTVNNEKDFKLVNNKPIKSYNDFKKNINLVEAPVSDGRKHESTEIFPALLDALDYIHGNKQENTAPALILYSSEFSNIYNNKQTKIDVISKAREYNIPIYTIHYPFYHEKYNLNELSDKTYGKRIVSNTENIEETTKTLLKSLQNIPQNASGKNYSLRFKTPNKPDGNTYNINLEISSLEQFTIQYSTPSFFKYFFSKKNNIIASVVGMIILLLLILILFILLAKKKKKEREEQEQKLDSIKKDAQESLAKKEEEWETKEKEKEEKQKLAEQKLKENEFLNELNNLFKKSKVYPSISLERGPKVDINQPIFSIGRASDNTLTIDIQSVSKNHAIVGFAHNPNSLKIDTMKQYALWDLNSTNGTLVNGVSIPTLNDIKSGATAYVLQNNDLVQMGELRFVFNI